MSTGSPVRFPFLVDASSVGQSNLFAGSISVTCLCFISVSTGDGLTNFARGRWHFARSTIGYGKSPSPSEPHHAPSMNVPKRARLVQGKATVWTPLGFDEIHDLFPLFLCVSIRDNAIHQDTPRVAACPTPASSGIRRSLNPFHRENVRIPVVVPR
jgi:hypothetical protein